MARCFGQTDEYLAQEWSACLNFLSANREFFKERRFQSRAFEKTNFFVEYVPERERDISDKKDGKKFEVDKNMHFNSMPEYKQERVRSEKIVSFVIADLWLFMAKHLKANHPVQFMYL